MTYILHLSDLHFADNASAHNFKGILLKEAGEKAHNVPRGKKLLIITGDFHNFPDNDYHNAEVFLHQLVEKMDLDFSQDVFIVPGNHDVGNENSLNQLLGKDDSDWTKINEAAITLIKSGNGGCIIERLYAFRPYSIFAKHIGIYNGNNDDDFPATTHVRSWRGKLNILHLNTALVADGKSKTDQMTDTTSAASDSTWKGSDINIPSIAIGHNNYYDIKEDQRKQLAITFALHNVSAYLCGDNHLIETDPERQMIRLEAGQKTGVEIPNLVAAKGIADENDNYSEIGYCWHVWNEETNQVTVEFRKWSLNNLSSTVPFGDNGAYIMRRHNESASNSIPEDKGKPGEGPSRDSRQNVIQILLSRIQSCKELKTLAVIVSIVSTFAILLLILLTMLRKSPEGTIITNEPEKTELQLNTESNNTPVQTTSNVYYYLGLSYYEKGEYERAIESLRAVDIDNASYSDAQNLLYSVVTAYSNDLLSTVAELNNSGQFSDSLALLYKGVQLIDDNLDLQIKAKETEDLFRDCLYEEAKQAYQNNDYDNAMQTLKNGLKIMKDDEKLTLWIEKLEEAKPWNFVESYSYDEYRYLSSVYDTNKVFYNSVLSSRWDEKYKYNIEGQYERVTGTLIWLLAGIDHPYLSPPTITFHGDGKDLYEGSVDCKTGSLDFEIDLTGIINLEISMKNTFESYFNPFNTDTSRSFYYGGLANMVFYPPSPFD